MSHEREVIAQAIVPEVAREDGAAPGRGTKSSHLVAPTVPVVSALLRKADGGVSEGAEHAVAAAASSADGQPLPTQIQRKFEGSLGTSLEGVRVHTGGASAAAAAAVGAKAYTTGQDIHFAVGQYDFSSAAGEHLLAHEVAHTVQQRGATPTRQNKLDVSSPADAAEHEADRAADAMVRGAPAVVTTSDASTAIQRRPENDQAFQPTIAPIVAPPPEQTILNNEFFVQLGISNASEAPSNTTVQWEWEGMEGGLTATVPPGTTPHTRAGLRAMKVGRGAALPRVTTNNARVLGSKVQVTTPQPEVAWTMTVEKGGQGGSRRDPPTENGANLFRGDTVKVRAVMSKVHDAATSGITANVEGSKGFSTTGPTIASNTYDYTFRADDVGEKSVTIRFDVPDNVRIGKQYAFRVGNDFTHFVAQIATAITDQGIKFDEASARLDDAANAYNKAKKRHEAALSEADRQERLQQELLMNAFLAGVGGGIGGAVGAGLRGIVSGAISDGALTDLGKDLAKFAIRSAEQIAGALGSGRADAGVAGTGGGGADATAMAAGGGGGARAGVGTDPFDMLTSLSASLKREKVATSRRLSDLSKKVELAATRNATGKELAFTEDPAAIVAAETQLKTINDGMSVNEVDYSRALWHAWLSKFAHTSYKVQVNSPYYPKYRWDVRNNVDGKAITRALKQAASECGESYENWMATYVPEAKAKAEQEKAKGNEEEREYFKKYGRRKT